MSKMVKHSQWPKCSSTCVPFDGRAIFIRFLVLCGVCGASDLREINTILETKLSFPFRQRAMLWVCFGLGGVLRRRL
jgi:hypothetical protein